MNEKDKQAYETWRRQGGYLKPHSYSYEAAFKAGWQAAPVHRDAQTGLVQQEPVAKIVSSGDNDLPLLQWISADHSFRAPIGSLLYAHPSTPPDVAELVEALKLADAALEGAHMNADVVYKKVKAALAKHGCV